MNEVSQRMSLLRIENPEAAQIISNQKARRFLECFLAQERSVSQVATELRVDMSSVIYRVNQFMRLGLIMLTRVEPRGGRAINYYRTVEDAFFVPFSVVPLAAESELSPGVSIQQHQLLQKSVEHAWAEVWGKSNTQGYHLSRLEKGPSLNVVIEGEYVNPESLYQKLMAPEAPAVLDTWRSGYLNPEDAKNLQRDIVELLRSYETRVMTEGKQKYLLRIAMAPVKDG